MYFTSLLLNTEWTAALVTFSNMHNSPGVSQRELNRPSVGTVEALGGRLPESTRLNSRIYFYIATFGTFLSLGLNFCPTVKLLNGYMD